MKKRASKFIVSPIKSFVLKAGGALVPILVALALGVAQPAQAASSTVVVATTPNPTNCGRYHSAVTNLEEVLSTTTKGTILLCPGNYASPGQITISGASRLTIKQAVRGLSNRPRIVFADAATFGLFFENSGSVTLDGLDLDAFTNTHVFFAMLAVSQSNLVVRNSILVGGVPFNYGIQYENAGSTPHKLTVSHVEIHNAAQGMNVSGLTKLSVSSSLIDGENAPRGTVNTGIAVEADFVSGFHPTGTISKSIIRDNNVGILIDGSQLSIDKNTFTGNNISVQIDQFGDISPVIKNNKVTHNDITVVDGGAGVLVTLLGDPSTAQLLNTVVSGNKLRPVTVGGTTVGIQFQAPAPAKKSLTGVVSGNTLTNFGQGKEIINVDDFAGLKLKNNKIKPPMN